MATRRRSRVPTGIFAAGVRVLRFYPDGTVLHVIIKPAPGPEEASQIATWLRKGNQLAGVHKTTYSRIGRSLSLSTTDPLSGQPMKITGTSRGEALTLNLKVLGREVHAENFHRIWPLLGEERLRDARSRPRR